MKTKPNPFIPFLSNPCFGRFRLVFAAITTTALIASHSAHAATLDEWKGAGTSVTWATAANWVGGTPAIDLTTNTALFNSASYSFQPNAGTTSIAGVQVGDGIVSTGALTITTTGLSLGDSGVLVNANAGTVGIGAVKIGANQNWQNNSSSLLTFSSTVSNVGDIAPFTLTLNGAGTGGTTITGVVSNGGTTGTTGINVNTTNGITTLSASNTFTGGLNIQQGTVKLGAGTAAGAGLVTIGNTGTSGVLDLNGASRTFNSLTTAGTAVNQKITNTAAGNATVNLTGAATSNFGGVIENGTGGGTTALTLNNAAANLTLSGANTYTGATTLTAGAVVLGNKSAFGGSTVAFNVVPVSANTDLIGANALANAWSFTSLQTFQGSNSIELAGAVTTGASKTLTNNIITGKSLTLSNASILVGANSATSSTLTLAGTGDTNVSGNLLNNVTGAGTSALTYTGSGTLTLGGANTYTGATNIGALNGSAAGTLKLSGSGTLGTGAGAVTVFTGTLDLNNLPRTLGNTLTLGGGAAGSSSAVSIGASGALTLGGNFTFTATNNPNGAAISGQTLNLGVPRTFTVNDSTNAATDLTLSAAIGDGNGIFDVTKAGTGTMNYTPNVAITGTPTLTVSAGTLQLSGTVSGGNGVFDIIKAGAGTLLYGQNITLAASQTVNLTGAIGLSGAISGGFGITLNGTGTLSLGGATGNAAASPIIANSGTSLTFDSSTAGSTGTTRAASVTLKGASLNVLGNSTANSVDTITGILTVNAPSTFGGAGANTVSVTADPATNARLSADSLLRATNGAVFFRGTNLGLNTIASNTAGTSNIVFTGTPPSLVGGGGAATSLNISIIPWAVGATTANGVPSSFVTYGANGIRPLDSGEYDTTIPAVVSTNNVKLNGASPVISNDVTTINSLFLNNVAGAGAIVLSGTGALTVTSGAIYADLTLGGNNNVLTISKPIAFGAVEGVIGTMGTSNSKTLSLTGGISGTAGITIYDTGAVSSTQAGVNIGSATTYTGNTIIHGSVIAANANALPNFTNSGRTGDIYVYGSFGVNDVVRINGLYGTGRVSNPFSSFKTLTVGDNNATSTFDGAFSTSNLNVTKMGTGTLTLTGTNSAYTGFTAIQNGTVSAVTLNNIAAPNASSGLGRPITVANGTIALGATTTTGQLTVTGNGEITDRVVNLAGTTGGAKLDQSGTGLLKFTSAFTATGAGIKTLTLQGSTVGTGEIAAAIVDNSGTNKTSVTKTGTGTWTLSGTNTYTGGTTVSGGTLSLGTATLADTSIVDVASGAVLNLSHGAVDTVAEFRINGVSQGNGTFTSANSSGRITGSGSLQVGPSSDPFVTWIGTFPSLTGPDTAKTADPDNDGQSNFVEFALDGNPASGTATGKVRSRIETVGVDQALVITLPVRAGAVFDNLPGPAADATIDNLIYTVAGTNDLAAFDQGVTEIAVSSSNMPSLTNASWTYRTFRLNGAIGGGTPRGPKGFLRVGITSTP